MVPLSEAVFLGRTFGGCLVITEDSFLMNLERNAKVAVDSRRIGTQRGRRRFVYDGAALHEIDAVGKAQRRTQVLFNKQHGDTALCDLIDLVTDLGDELRHDAFRRLIKHNERGFHDEAARERKHLLLPAGECASRLRKTFFEAGKAAEYVSNDFRIWSTGQAECEIFLHREQREHAAPLGNIPETKRGQFMGRDAFEIAPVVAGGTAGAFQKAKNCAKCRGLADAIAPEQRYGLAGFDSETDAAQYRNLANVGFEIINRERRHRSSSSGAPR
ncbi:protein of unknown function [Candidatus Filomicrobium marinum]|nr:protein of unknown function [Candidatus Filomicrobium marinum]